MKFIESVLVALRRREIQVRISIRVGFKPKIFIEHDCDPRSK
jgi:hypothetical protein